MPDERCDIPMSLLCTSAAAQANIVSADRMQEDIDPVRSNLSSSVYMQMLK